MSEDQRTKLKKDAARRRAASRFSDYIVAGGMIVLFVMIPALVLMFWALKAWEAGSHIRAVALAVAGLVMAAALAAKRQTISSLHDELDDIDREAVARQENASEQNQPSDRHAR